MKSSSTTIVLFAVQTALLFVGCTSLPTRLADPDKTVREAAFNEVLTSTDFDLKNAKLAVDAINNPKELDKLATEANSSWIRMNAAGRVSNSELAQTIVLNENENRNVRMAALEGMSDTKTLQTIVTKIADREVRLRAVQRIDDSNVLAQIATTDDAKEVRLDAAKRITSANAMKILFKNTKDWEVFKELASRVNDTSIRSEFASAEKWRKTVQSDTRWRARLEAINHLRGGRDDDVLFGAAIIDSENEVRLAAIEKMENQDYLKLIWKNNGGVVVPGWKTAFLSGMPREVIQREIENEVRKEQDVRSSAVKHLEEEYRNKMIRVQLGLDKEYRSESEKNSACRAVLFRITDNTFLTAVLKDNSAFIWNLGGMAFSRIVSRLNERELTELALNGNNNNCVDYFIEKIQDQTVLARIAQQRDHRGRRAAISRLTDQTVLSELAQLDNDDNIRDAAGQRLVELARGAKGSKQVLAAARGEFGRESQLKILSMPNVSKAVYEIAFKGFLTRSGGSGVDINKDEEIIKECPYDDLVQWVASHKIGDGDRGYWNQRHAKEELVRRGLYSQDQLDDENFKHDAVRELLFGQ